MKLKVILHLEVALPDKSFCQDQLFPFLVERRFADPFLACKSQQMHELKRQLHCYCTQSSL